MQKSKTNPNKTTPSKNIYIQAESSVWGEMCLPVIWFLWVNIC